MTNELCVSESIKYYVHQPAGASDYTADVIHLCTIMKFVTIEQIIQMYSRLMVNVLILDKSVTDWHCLKMNESNLWACFVVSNSYNTNVAHIQPCIVSDIQISKLNSSKAKVMVVPNQKMAVMLSTIGCNYALWNKFIKR